MCLIYTMCGKNKFYQNIRKITKNKIITSYEVMWRMTLFYRNLLILMEENF